MADDVITLNVDESPAQRAIDRVNARLDEYEKKVEHGAATASRMVETGASAIERMALRAADSAERTFSALERAAEAVGRGIGNAATSMGHMLIKLAEMAAGVGVAVEAWRLLRSHIAGASSEAGAHAGTIDRLVNAWREFRITSGTVLSAVTGSLKPMASSIGMVAAGLAVEESIRAANRRGQLQEQLAFVAARDEYEISDVQQLRNASLSINRSPAFLRTAADALYDQVTEVKKGGGLNDAQKTLQKLGVIPKGYGYDITEDPRSYSKMLGDIATAFDKIVDPVDRAEKAIAIFGEDAAQRILPELDGALARNIEQAKKWGAVLSDEQAGEIAKFRKNVTDAQHWLRDLTSEFSVAAEGARNWISAMAAEGANTFINNYKEIFGWIDAVLQKGDELLEKLIPGQTAVGNWLMGLIPSDKDLKKGVDLGAAVREQQSLAGDRARIAIGVQLHSQAMEAEARFGSTRAGVSQEMSEAERKRDEAARFLDRDQRGTLRDTKGKPMELTPEQRLAYSQQYLAGAQESRLYKNQLQGIEDRRRSIEAAIRSADEVQKERGANLSTLDKITFDFAFALRPQYIIDEDGNMRSFRQPPAAVANLLEIARLKTAAELHRQSAELMAGGGRIYQQATQTGIFQGAPEFVQQDLLEFHSRELQRQAAFMPFVARSERRAIIAERGGLPGDLQAFANQDEARKHDADVRVAAMEREMRLNEQLVKLQSGPGGEARAIEQGYALRLQYAEREYQIRRGILGDELAGEKLVEQQQEAGIERITRMAELQHQRFESLKSSVGNLFDAAFTKSGSMVQALENFVKGIILTPIKEGLSAIVAKELMPALYGKDGKGGIIGGLFGIFGGKDQDPIKMATDQNTLSTDRNSVAIENLTSALSGGSAGAASASAPTSSLAGIARRASFAGLAGWLTLGSAMASAPAMTGGEEVGAEEIGAGSGATAGLMRNAAGLWTRWDVNSGGAGGAMGSGEAGIEGSGLPGGSPGDFGGEVSGAAAQALGFGGKLKGALPGLAALFGGQLAMGGIRQGGMGGNIQTIAGGALTGYGLASTIAPHLASGALAGGALGAGLVGAGAGLVGAGLSRGGVSGLGMDIGGGALIGMQFGGPLGAAIGAGAGAIAGLIRLGIHGKSEQLHDAIKEQYGVSIPANSGVLKQILGMINQNYGGSISMGIRATPVMDLISLYAQSTGQPFGLENKPRAAYLIEQGGGLYQQAGYDRGQSYGFASNVLSNYNGQSFDRLISGSSVTTGPTIQNVSLHIDGQGAAAFMTGSFVTPSFVSSQVGQANEQSDGRRERANATLSPTAILG